MKFLARDVSTFSLMIEGNFVYVDKTHEIYNLYATKDRYHFLSRPRRFGKSLLISTLQELFSGNKDLFNGLWIANSDFAFAKHPIIHLDFSSIAHITPQDLKTSLKNRLNKIGETYGIDLSQETTVEDAAYALIIKLAQTNSVVLLIDEYDQPLLKHIKDIPVAEANQEILKGFYEVVKSLDAHFRAIFITGVTKFAKTSLFSGMNNLQDISENPQFAALLGYTEEEIKHYFAPAIEEFAITKKVAPTAIIDEMRRWYNGYRFSTEDLKVYNPFSMLYYLKDKKLANYWFSSGTPSFLVQVLKDDPLVLNDLENNVIETSTFGAFEVGEVPTLTLLYQSGYLTIKKYESHFETDTFVVGYPNEEIKRSVAILMMGVLTDQKQPAIESALFKLRMALGRNDITTFCEVLQTLFAQIPYQLHIAKEAYYHSLLQFLVYLLGFEGNCEFSTSNGRIDLVLDTKNRIFIFEFKLNLTGEKAMEQIIAKRYYEKFLNSGKELTIVGISFNFKDKKITVDCSQEDMGKLGLKNK